ncbi:hypothetical protein [Sphingosinithalassobacter sp. LHW66-3]|uniref:hypothetical protein n=1 Tax=Sphingosinithalassobacter sp. LHW66-3 TaxID=3424718 RepID=UPI003D6A744C
MLLSTGLTGAALALAPSVRAQDAQPVWQPQADAEARAGEPGAEVAFELLAPLAQNEANLLFVAGRIAYDELYDRSGSVTFGGRGRVGDDLAIGVNVGADFYRSNLTSNAQTAVSFGLEGFTSVFDVHVNYRLPTTDRRTILFADPDLAPDGVLTVEDNRLIERRTGFRLEEVPLHGVNGEIGARAPLTRNLSVRAAAGAFDYRDRWADESFHGFRGSLELYIEDPLGAGSRFRLGAQIEDDNRFGTHASATVRLTIPLGSSSGGRRQAQTRLERQMGERVRRDYVAAVGTRASDLSSTTLAIDARTGAEFGGIYYTSGAATAAGAGTNVSPTTIEDAVSRAGVNGVVVALGEGGPIATGGVTLATDQYLVGGAGSVMVRRANGAVTPFSFGGTNGSIVGTNAAGAAVTLGQGSVVRDVTISGSGAGVVASGVGAFALERVFIQNTGGVGLTLANTLGPVVLDGLTVRGAAGAGVLVRGGSSVTLRDSAIAGGAGAIDIDDGGAALTVALSNLALSATGGTVLDIDGSGAGSVTVAGLAGLTIAGGNGESGGFAARSVRFDADATAAGNQLVDAGRMQIGAADARVNGAGVSLAEVEGVLSFSDLDIANGTGTGLLVRNTKAGSFTLATGDGSVDTAAGTALDLDPLLLDLRFTAVQSAGAAGAGVVLDDVTGAGAGGNTLAIGTLTITGAGQQGLLVTGGSTGFVTIGGGSISGSGGAGVQIGEAGVAGSGGTIGLNFGGTISGSGTGPLVHVSNTGGAINFTGAITGTGPVVIEDTLAGSTVTLSGPITLTGTSAGTPAISLNNLMGSVGFSGPITISNPMGDAIRIGSVAGGASFGNVTITGLGSGTGLDLTGTQGNVSFGTLQISGTSIAGSTGIDLTGTTNSGAIVISGPSAISGVDVGVDLTNASATGSFRFGDGNASNGTGSSITANTVIVIAGMNTGTGIYDFSDATLNGDTSNLSGGSFTTYYVMAGATGSGIGSNDPGSLAGALASGAQYIVLLNNPDGGQDVIDAITTGGTFTLGSGQALLSFRDTDSFSVRGAAAPQNLIVTGVSSGVITNPFAGSGAALLTSSAVGGATLTLGNDSRVDGVQIGHTGGGVGILGQGLTSATILNSTVSGSGGAIAVTAGGATSSLTLGNLDLSASGGTVLSLSGAGAGTLSVSASDVSIAATGGAAGLSLDTVASSGIAINAITTGASATTAVSIAGVTGASVSLGTVTIGGTATGAGLSIAGSSAGISAGAVNVMGSAGDAVWLSGNSGPIALGSLSILSAGGAGLRIAGAGGDVSISSGSIGGSAGAGLSIQGVNTGATLSLGSLALTGNATGALLADIVGSVRFGGAVTIANSVGSGLAFGAGNSGTTSFGAVSINGSGTAGISLAGGSTGNLSFGDVSISGIGAGGTGVDARGAGGAIAFGTLNISGSSASGTRGIDLTGASFAGSLTVAQGGTITGVGTGVDLTNAAITGSFRYGDGSSSDADGAASTINAVTPIAAAGLNAGVGRYDFADVALVGDTSALATGARLFFVEAGRTGSGTQADPGSLAAALAANAQVVVLLNNPTGGQDQLSVSGVGSFDLLAGQRLISFLNGDTQAVGGSAPANLVLHGVTPGLVTNPYAGSGAPLLTSTGAVTVRLANNNVLDGLLIGGAGIGIDGAGVSNVSIANSQISGALGAVRLTGGGAAASATLRNLALTSSGGTVLSLSGAGGGSLGLQGSGIVLTATGAARALAIDTVMLNGALSFGAVSTATAAGDAVSLSGIGGSGVLGFTGITVGGTSAGSGITLAGNSAVIDLGTVTISGAAADGLQILGNAGDVTVGGMTIAGVGGSGVRVEGLQGAFKAAGATVSSAGTAGILLSDIDGSATFTGPVSIAAPGSAGIRIGAGSSGTIDFAETDITALGANATGLDARSASGTVRFATLDIAAASTSGTRGIDLTGATYGGTVAVTQGGTITGVGTGVDLTNAAITGSFRYGDGSSSDADGAASTISAITPLAIAGLSGSTGGYDFSDVNLVGDTSGLAGSASLYWVRAGASGAGTRSDPGSLAGAAAAGADIILLLNDPAGGNDILDANDLVFGTGGTFTLGSGQQLLGFLNGDSLAVPGGAPANVLLYNVATGIITNPFAGSGAPTLTTSAGGNAATLVVTGNNLIDGVRIANGGTGVGVFGSGAANIIIRNSILSGANGALQLLAGGGSASAALANLQLRASGGTPLLVSGVGGSFALTQFSNIAIDGGYGETAGARLASVLFDADLATAGFQAVDSSLRIGSAGGRVTGSALDLDGATGSLNFTNLSIFNSGGTALRAYAPTLNLASAAGTIDVSNGTAIDIADTRLDLTLDSVIRSGAGGGVSVTNGVGIGAGGRAMNIGTLSASGGTFGIAITGASAGSFAFGAGSTISGTSASAIALGGAADLNYGGSVVQTAPAALLDVVGHTGTLTFAAGSSLSATGGGGLSFADADGTYSFAGTTVLSGGGGIAIAGGSAGSFTFGNASISDAAAAAVEVRNSTASLSYAGTIGQAGGAAIDVSAHATGTLDFSGATLTATGGSGLAFSDADGSYTFGTTALSGGARIAITGGSGGSFTFGSASISGASGAALDVQNSTANVSYTGTISQATGAAIAVSKHATGTLDLSGAAITATGGSGLTFDNADGAYRFGSVALSGGARIAIVNGASGGFTFGDVDVTGLGASATAVDLTGVGGSVSFETLDITGTSITGSRGIDLTGNSTSGNIVVLQGGTITGVGIGIDLTNAAIAGNFRYGDGSNTDADGAASTISGVTPLVIAGLDGGRGSYDFADVNLVGDTTGFSVRAYFVQQGANGSGARSDPGSLAGAMASNATYIVLLNDPTGGADILDVTGAGGSLILDGGQFLYSFRDTDSFNVGGGAPANVTLYNVQTGVLSNPFAGSGAPTLTGSGASPTVTLGGSNILDGLVITNSGTGAGVWGNAIGGASIIRNSTISGGAAGAINVQSGAANTVLALSNLTLAAAGGNILNLVGGGAGSLTLSAFANMTGTHSSETGGFVLSGVRFDADPTIAPGLQPVSAGALNLGTSAARITGVGLSLSDVTGTLNFTDLNIANDSGTGLLVANAKANNFLLGTTGGTVDTTGGTAIDLDPLAIAMTLDSVRASGGAFGILLDQVEGRFTVTGAVEASATSTAAIAIRNNSAQTDPLDVMFQGAVTVANTGGAGVMLTNNGGAAVSFLGGLDIATTSGAGLSASGGGTLVIAKPTVGANRIVTGAGQALSLDGMTIGAAGAAFDSIATTSSTNAAMTLQALSLAGSLNIADLAASGGGGGAAFANLSGAGSVNLTGRIDIDGGTGFEFGGTLGTINIADTAGSVLTIDGAGVGLAFNGVGSGTVAIGGGGGSAAIAGSTVSSVLVNGASGGALSYAGSIITAASPVLAVTNSAATITLSGAITSTTSGGAFTFDNADGSYTISGAVDHSGGTGISVNGTSSGTLTFSGGSKRFNTGAANTVVMNGTGTLAFTGGGLDIETTSGSGIVGNGTGILVTAGSGNRIVSGTGAAMLLDGTTIGAGGLNFSTISVTGAVTGLRFASLLSTGGGTIDLGTVTLQGITSRGIDVEGGLGAALNIADFDVALGDGSATAFDLNGAALAAAISVGDFDVTNAGAPGTSIGVDLRGTTGGQSVRLGTSAVAGASPSISGVNTGVFLDAGSNANFVYGDGEAATDGGAIISAPVGIDASAAPLAGTYDFQDVVFTASPGRGFGIGRTVFIDSDGAVGGGNGSGADAANPMTLAAAELAQLAGDTFLLVNNGSAISAAGSNGDNSFALLAGSSIRGFGGGAISLNLTIPSTIRLASTSLTIADPGGGAATLTSGAGASVVTLGSGGNSLVGFNLAGNNSVANGVVSGVVGASNMVLRDLTMQGFAGSAISLTNAPGVLIENLVFSGNATDLTLVGGTNATLRSLTSSGATTALLLNGVSGTTTLADIGISGAATGLSAVAAGGTIVATNVDISGSANAGLAINGGTASFTFDAASSLTQNVGGFAVDVTGNHTSGSLLFGGTISATSGSGLRFSNADGTYGFTGVSTLNGGDAGIDILSGSDGSFTFGTGTSITAPSGNGLHLADSNANLTFSGSITNAGGNAVYIDNHDAGNVLFQTGSITATNGLNGGIVISNSHGGEVRFTGAVSLSTGTAAALSLIDNSGSSVVFDTGAAGLELGTTSGVGLNISGGGTVSILGANNRIMTGSGTVIAVNNATADNAVLDLSLAIAGNVSGTNGIQVVRSSTGAITGSIAVSSGAITATSRGVLLDGDSLNFTYGGSIATSGATARSVEAIRRTGGTATLSGNISDTSQGISVTDNSGGTVAFTGQSIGLSTGANAAVTLARNTGSTIRFAPLGGGTGLDIFTTSGTGFSASGGGTIIVTGSDNSIQTGTGGIVDLDTVAAGTGGINFATLASTGTVGSAALRFNNFGGTSFAVTGSTSVAGTSAANDGISVAGATDANLSFGSYTAGGIGGDAIDIAGAGTGTIAFDSVAISAAGGSGVRMAGAANGLSITSGSIGGAVGDLVSISGGTGAVTIGAALSKSNAGNVVAVNGRTAGVVTFAGNVAANGASGGIVIGNSAGTVNFTGQTIALNTGGNAAVTLTNNTGAINFAPAGGGGGLSITTTSGTGIVATIGGTLTVQGTGNSIATATGRILDITGLSAGAADITFATLSSSGATNGTAINLTNLDGDTFRVTGATTIAGTTGATADGIFIGGNSAATIAFGATTIANTGNDGIEVNGTGNGAVTFGSATINNTAAHGVNLVSSGNSVSINGGAIGGVNDTTLNGVNISGGTGVVDIAASITKDSGGWLVQSNGHSGGDVTFSGNLTRLVGASGGGIYLLNNGGGTFTFSGASKAINTGNQNNAVLLTTNAGTVMRFINGGLDIDTTASAGLIASGGGTLAIEGSGNSITSTTGRALEVSNTEIGAAGLTFQSISSNGASIGIFLNNTGTAGGLTVTGTTTSGSGGTIANSTGDGIALLGTAAVRLSYMNITGNNGNGIGGTLVDGFLIDRMLISGNGSNAAVDHSGINISNLSGSASNGARPTGILNSTIQNNYEFEVQISNTAGTLTNFQVIDSTLSAAAVTNTPHGNLFNFLGSASATMGLTVTNTSFTGNFNPTTPPATITGTGLHIDTTGVSTTAIVTGSTFTNNNAGVSLSTGPGSSSLTYNLAGNSFTGHRSHAISDFQNGNGPFGRTVNGTIVNNVIGAAGVAGSGSLTGNGISISNEGAVNATYLISGNMIRNLGTGSGGTATGAPGLSVNVGLSGVPTSGGTTNLTIVNNVFSDINSRAIEIQDNQVSGGVFPTIRVNMTGNGFANILGQAGNGQFMRLRVRDGQIQLTQMLATGANNGSELDDANGFNDPTKINVSTGGSGAIAGGFTAPPLPTTVSALP